MGLSNIRVMVVDDSPLIREMISDNIREAPGIELAGVAVDGQEAVDIFDKINPDIVTLDIQMPRMDGLETLDALLAKKAVPIIMVSALTQLGADITLQALEKGALDFVAKPDGIQDAESCLKDDLLRKIRSMVSTDVEHVLRIRKKRAEQRKARRAQLSNARNVSSPETQDLKLDDKLIAIGISTGGPPALTSLFESLHTPTPPIVIVQHMPEHFTKAFAQRLDSISPLNIKEAETGDILKPNSAYIAQGGKHLQIRKNGRIGKLLIRDGEAVSGHKPSVDVMMKSAVEVYSNRCLGVIMTGMGRDGSDGCAAIRMAGGYVVGQDEESSDVYGMNKVAFVEGNVDRQFGLDEAAGTIAVQVRRLWGKSLAGSK